VESISVRQLEFAVAVEEAGAMCAAAKRVHVSQPSLSQQIRLLETTLGVQLFERTPAGTTATAAGTAFLAHAHVVLDELRRARASVLLQAEPLRLGVEDVVDVRRVLSACGDAPGADGGPEQVQVLRFRDPARLRAALSAREVDVAVGRPRPEGPAAPTPLGSVRLLVMTSATALPPTGGRWICTPGTADLTAAAVAAAGPGLPRAVTEVEDLEFASAMVEQGRGIALLPERLQSATVVPLAGAHPAVDVPVGA